MFLSLSIALAAQSHALQQPLAPEHDAALAPLGEAEVRDVKIESTGPLDDAIPLPVAEVWAPSDAGDVLVAPASGDPFFLGFAAGPHHPAAGELVDPDLYAQAQSHYDDGRPTQETYAFVMFEKRITDERIQQLVDLGCRVLAFHPHYTLKVALPAQVVDQVAALDFVHWIGAPKRWQKIHPTMSAAIANAPTGEPLEVYINVYDSDMCAASTSRAAAKTEVSGPDGVTAIEDPNFGPRKWMSNGWQQRALQSLGVEVGEYVDSIRAFRAYIHPASIEQLIALDFVQFVEPQPEPTLGHDESMPMTHMDKTRVNYNGGTSSAAVAGQFDSGVYWAHNALGGAWVASNFTAESASDDDCEHGSHVAGTILGSGAVDDSYEGGADGLGWGGAGRFWNGKIFSGVSCSYASGTSLASILGSTDSSYTDGNGEVTPRPMAINHSWGSGPTSGGYFGSEADARTIDDNVYTYRQLQCFIAHNYGPGASTTSLQGSAKNSFTVGGVIDYQNGSLFPGEMYNSSGRGPTADNRWKPNIVAPAQRVTSTLANTTTGYVTYTGTSMAAPHVTGLASQLADHYPFLRHNPSTLGALMMATATTKNDALLTSPSSDPANHLNTYGAGRIQAYRAHAYTGIVGIYGWTTGSSYVFADVTVPAGATRIVACLWYHEPAASSGASVALVNDYDLVLDSPTGGIAVAGDVGEYTAQQSSLNNAEIRSINSPVAGTWRIKIWPDSVTQTCRLGLAFAVYSDDTTPTPTLSVTANDTYVQPGDDVVVTSSYYNPEFIASAVFLDSTSVGDVLTASTTTLEDGATTDLLDNQQLGRDVLIGDVAPNDSRVARWTTHWNSEGVKSFSVTARSDNAIDQVDSATVYVDGTPPTLPTNLGSSTHTVNVWSNDPTITWTWTAATDSVSGVDGYGVYVAANTGAPSQVKDIEQVTSYNHAFTVADSGDWYLNLKPVDNSGNWNASHASAGPYRFDFVQPNYVTGLTSPTNAVGSYSCNANVSMSWDPCTDGGGSGMAGFSYHWDHVAVSTPDATLELGPAATGVVSAPGASSQPWYFHLRPYDIAGNGQNQFNFGPIYLVDPVPAIYCTGKTNSIGCVPAIGSTGTPSASSGTFTVTCTNTLNNKNGLLFFGATASAVPFQGGTKCVAAPTQRGPNFSSGGSPSGNDCSGAYAQTINAAFMSAYGIDIGDTLYAQWWMRDPASASTTGLSNAIKFTICQ